MKKMTAERRKLAAMAGSVAAMSGVGPVLLRQTTHQWYWAWMAFVAAVEILLIVRMVRWRRSEGCR